MSVRLEVAEEMLEDLRKRVKKASVSASPEMTDEGAEGSEDAPAPPADDPWGPTVDAWAEEMGLPVHRETTGLFIGAKPPAARDPADDVPEEEKAFLARRDFVRTTGYDSIRAATSRGEDLAIGTMGREILRDYGEGGTDAVFLVRLKDVQFPPPQAFSPRDYADYLTAEVIGSGIPKGGFGVGAAAGGERVNVGLIQAGVRSFFGDYDFIKSKFDVRPNYEPPVDSSSR